MRNFNTMITTDKGGAIMITFSILDAFVSNWWVLLIRGILAVLFAIMAFTLPDQTLVTLMLLYGSTYAFVFGLMMIVLTFRFRGLLRLEKST
jgi:uncharacterized membrane protein HdeD (DUF308 family)